MVLDLLTLLDYEPPMGDLAIKPSFSFCKGLWTMPLDEENDAPENRIIHARFLQLHGHVKMKRLGVRKAQGYHKCGSRQDLDWVDSFRLWILTENGWHIILEERGLTYKSEDEVQWYSLEGVTTSSVIIEVRKAGVDQWWPSWNLVSGAFILEGEFPNYYAPKMEKTLKLANAEIENLPQGLNAVIENGEVRYKTRFLEVGFYLNRTGFSYLGFDDSGQGKTSKNLLKIQPGIFYQGVQLHLVGEEAVAAPILRYNVTGSTSVVNNKIRYEVLLGNTSQHYIYDWTIFENRLQLRIERKADKAMLAWQSCAWMIGLETKVSPAHVIGNLIKKGETGNLDLPIIFHAPNYGSMKIQNSNKNSLWRTDVHRSKDLVLNELKVGEIPQENGMYLLPVGHFSDEIDFIVTTPDVALEKETPVEIVEAVKKISHTALTFRSDTATLSNNGASIHCPICMDNWSAITMQMQEILPGFKAIKLLQYSLERWLDGGQGYTSGRLSHMGKTHDAEDEYLMTGAACLLGLSDFILDTRDIAWFKKYEKFIRDQIERMRARDLDGDGLIESPYRTGVSGTGQWSTCWFDVVSYGWKDAFANALLFPALVKLAKIFDFHGDKLLAKDLTNWAQNLKNNYSTTFMNPDTGWLAGWRCKENKLHDYAFLSINGAAVSNDLMDEKTAKSIMNSLWNEMKKVNIPDPVYGLPGNLWHIPDEDLADIMQGFPMGYYQNGGRTHSQTRHFVNGLYKVGMMDEADYLLRRLSKGMAEGFVFGGCKSGVDWRFWDDRPCGYEGLLTDQFGILDSIFQRYGIKS